MKIIFYKYTGEQNTINKILINGIEINGNLKEDCSIINPAFTIDFNNNLVDYNYCYIEAFKRYYYITDITFKNKMMHINLHVDVLKSFASDILASKGLIQRSNVGNKFIADGLAKTLASNKVVFRNLGTGLTKKVSYIFIKGK